MATTDANRTPPDGSLLTTAVGLGALAALGSILVALGLTDTLAIVDGYRPGGWIVLSYARAFLVTVAGWALIAVAGLRALGAIRGARGPRR